MNTALIKDQSRVSEIMQKMEMAAEYLELKLRLSIIESRALLKSPQDANELSITDELDMCQLISCINSCPARKQAFEDIQHDPYDVLIFVFTGYRNKLFSNAGNGIYLNHWQYKVKEIDCIHYISQQNFSADLIPVDSIQYFGKVIRSMLSDKIKYVTNYPAEYWYTWNQIADVFKNNESQTFYSVSLDADLLAINSYKTILRVASQSGTIKTIAYPTLLPHVYTTIMTALNSTGPVYHT